MSSFFYFVIVYICILQTYFTVAIPLSSLQHNTLNLNVTLTSNANETYLFKRQEKEGLTKYTVKTLFLIDKTPKSQEEAERQKLAGILESINQKLRTEGTFGKYYFQLEATKVVFQETLYLNDPTLSEPLKKWTTEYSQKYASEPVHAGLLLTRIENFKARGGGGVIDPISLANIRETIKQRHLSIQKLNPDFYRKSSDPEILAPVHERGKDIYVYVSRYQKPSAEPFFLGFPGMIGASPVAGAPTASTGVTMGISNPATVCSHGATGVMSGYGEVGHEDAFGAILVHELFHGFGIGHDPEFVTRCQGFIMEDGVSGNPPMKFSPCSIAAMEILMKTPQLDCLKEMASNSNQSSEGEEGTEKTTPVTIANGLDEEKEKKQSAETNPEGEEEKEEKVEKKEFKDEEEEKEKKQSARTNPEDKEENEVDDEDNTPTTPVPQIHEPTVNTVPPPPAAVPSIPISKPPETSNQVPSEQPKIPTQLDQQSTSNAILPASTTLLQPGSAPLSLPNPMFNGLAPGAQNAQGPSMFGSSGSLFPLSNPYQ